MADSGNKGVIQAALDCQTNKSSYLLTQAPVSGGTQKRAPIPAMRSSTLYCAPYRKGHREKARHAVSESERTRMVEWRLESE